MTTMLLPFSTDSDADAAYDNDADHAYASWVYANHQMMEDKDVATDAPDAFEAWATWACASEEDAAIKSLDHAASVYANEEDVAIGALEQNHEEFEEIKVEPYEPLEPQVVPARFLPPKTVPARFPLNAYVSNRRVVPPREGLPIAAAKPKTSARPARPSQRVLPKEFMLQQTGGTPKPSSKKERLWLTEPDPKDDGSDSAVGSPIKKPKVVYFAV